jgi:methyl-accepting chemotaxis protein
MATSDTTTTATGTPALDTRQQVLYEASRHELSVRTDRIFGLLMCVQWVAAIAVAFFVSPKTWAGTAKATHIHVYAAVVLGGLITILPVVLPGCAQGRP